MPELNEDVLRAIEERRREWEEQTVRKSLQKFGATESLNRFYTPADIKGHDFLEKVGFPGEYPFTAGEYPSIMPTMMMARGANPGLVRAQMYSGYGTAEDTRDFYKNIGRIGGPNIAFDLPSQCGYDSDDPRARGEVGKVGVAVDTLRDFETIYEAFTGPNDLDKIASNWTINGCTNIILAMYIALAEKRGIPIDKLRGTPQNDILKEYVGRGTYNFAPRPSMRMTRDTITYCTEHIPKMNTISISAFHMRMAGATGPQTSAFTISNAIAYVGLGIDAGLDVDKFIRRFTFLGGGCSSMEFFNEIALARAQRRVWSRIMRERFESKDPRCWMMRGSGGAATGTNCTTAQRPLNNVIRGTVGAIMSALSGGTMFFGMPYDEPLGLGHSLEAMQLAIDTGRILQLESKLDEVLDPLAGSYYVESLTDKAEAEIWDIIKKIDDMGGAVAAIEQGYMQRETARGAYDWQRRVETGEASIVGVNTCVGEEELEVTTNRLVAHPYDPEKRRAAEEKQLATLAKVKSDRDNQQVEATLRRLEDAAKDQSTNLIPHLVEAVKAYASLGEICNVLRGVFGEYEPPTLA